MKVKRLLAAAITAFVALTSVLPVSAIDYGKEYENKPSGTYDVKFKDVPRNNWAFEYIGEMQKRGIINGYPDGKYYPDNYVERCEFAKIMVGAAGLRTGDASGEYFADVKYNDWFYEYVETAKEYLTGYKSFGQNYFRPNNYALREDIAVALVKLKGYDTKNTDQNILQTMFSDYDSISESAKPYVATAVDRGLVSGYDDGTFKGQDSITRAEAAAMLWRAYQYGNDNKTTEVSDNSNNSQTLGDADNNKSDDTKNDKKTDTNTDKKTDTKKNDNNTLTESKDDGKSYAVTTLAKATINDSLTDMTIDDNDTVYYINRKDNSLYKVAAKSGAGAKKLTSLSKLTYTETETRQETRTVKKKVEKVSSQSADEGAAIALAAVEDEDKSNDTSVTNNNESGKDKDDVTLDNGEMYYCDGDYIYYAVGGSYYRIDTNGNYCNYANFNDAEFDYYYKDDYNILSYVFTGRAIYYIDNNTNALYSKARKGSDLEQLKRIVGSPMGSYVIKVTKKYIYYTARWPEDPFVWLYRTDRY